MPLIYIFAGDSGQAQWLARHLEYKPNQWRYILSARHCDGLGQGDLVLIWGTAYRRYDYRQTTDRLIVQGCTLLTVSDELMRACYESHQ